MENFERIIDEKNELWRALQEVQELFEKTKNEKEQMGKLYTDFK